MKPFVSHDGQGAEVKVQINSGVVSSIELANKGNAQITFKVENFKFPVKGWTNEREPAFALLEKAKESGELIEYRIESQRKQNIPIETPIDDLLNNDPGKNIRSILAGVRVTPNQGDWVLTSEHVTNPGADRKVSGGRVPDLGDNDAPGAAGGKSVSSDTALAVLQEVSASESFTPEVTANLIAQALLSGADIKDVHEAVSGKSRRDQEQPAARSSFSTEAPSWKDWNGDGRANLGRVDVQAVIGVEKFVREQAVMTLTDDDLQYFILTILGIADRIQTFSYGEGFKADRGASSHSLIRGLIYDTIEHMYPLPDNAQTSDQLTRWVEQVGRTVMQRFTLAVNIAASTVPLAEISNPSFVSDSKSSANDIPQDEVPAEPVATLTSVATPVPEAELLEPAPEPEINDNEESSDVEPDAEDAPAVEASISGTYADIDDDDDSEESVELLDRFPQEFLDEDLLDETGKLDPAISPSEETKENFKQLVADAGITGDGLRKVVTLLEQTFGPRFGKIANIPEDALGDFIDFYGSTGAENFRKVVESAV